MVFDLKTRKGLRKFTALAFVALLLISLIDFLSGKLFLAVQDSDFLTAFPNFEISNLVGRPEFYRNTLAEQWMGQEYWQYGPMHQFITIPLYLLPSVYLVTTLLLIVLSLLYIQSIITYVLIIDPVDLNISKIQSLFLILVVFYPFLAAINQRNLEIVEVFLVVIAASYHRKSNFFMSGFIVGLAGGIKFLPLIIVLLFILEKNRKALLGFLLSFLPQIFLAQLMFGWERSFTYKLLSEGESETIPLRQGLADVILRLLGNNGGNYNLVYLIIALLVSLSSFVLLLKFFRVQQNVEERWRIWSFVLAFVCLIVPHSNNYYFVLFVPLIIDIFFDIQRNKERIDFFLYFFGLVLVSAPLPIALLWRLLPESEMDMGQIALQQIQSLSPMFFGGLLLLILAIKNSKSILKLPT